MDVWGRKLEPQVLVNDVVDLSNVLSLPTSKSLIPEQNGLQSTIQIPEPYREIFSEYPYFNKIQSAVLPTALYTDESFVISAPTGSGKTALFELAILQLLIDHKSNTHNLNPNLNNEEGEGRGEGRSSFPYKMIYVAPMKALCEERLVDWHNKFSKFGLNVISVTGDSNLVDLSCLDNQHLIVTTPEKWDSVTRRWRDNFKLVESVKLFMIDEIHLLNEERRGPTLEVIIIRMKTIQKAVANLNNCNNSYNENENTNKNKIRFVAASATMPNIDDLASFFSTNENKPAKYFLYGEETRPVPLKQIVYGYNYTSPFSPFKFDLNLNYKLQNVLLQHADGKPALIFCSTRKSVEMTSKFIAQNVTIKLSDETKQMLMDVAKNIIVNDGQVAQNLVHGIGYHHAGLSPESRHTIESLFRTGKLPVLVTTSSLAMGVNLPAHLVIVKSTKYYSEGQYLDYSASMLLQMIGRAGRPQFDVSGTAVIMTTIHDKAKYENMVGGCQAIESNLHRYLTEHMNAEICLKTITHLDVAMDWMSMTFLRIRAIKNPKHYNFSMDLSPTKIDDKLRDICQIEINKLASASLVTMEESMHIKATQTGMLMAKYYVNFKTMKLFLQVTGNEILRQLLSIISKSQEFSDMHLRVNDKKTLNLLNKCRSRETIRFPLSGKIKTLDMKINCIIQAMFGCLPILEQSLINEAQKIMRIGERIVNCLIEYLELKEKCYTALCSALILGKCFRTKLWENSPFLCRQFPGIGPMLNSYLTAANKKSFQDILDTDPRELERITKRKAPFGNELQDMVKHLPKFDFKLGLFNLTEREMDVEINGEEEETVGPVLQLKATVRLLNTADVVKQSLVKSKSQLILLVGDSLNNVLIYEKYSLCQLEKNYEQTVTVKLNANDNVNKIYGHFISEDWVGFDENVSLTIENNENNVDFNSPTTKSTRKRGQEVIFSASTCDTLEIITASQNVINKKTTKKAFKKPSITTTKQQAKNKFTIQANSMQQPTLDKFYKKTRKLPVISSSSANKSSSSLINNNTNKKRRRLLFNPQSTPQLAKIDHKENEKESSSKEHNEYLELLDDKLFEENTQLINNVQQQINVEDDKQEAGGKETEREQEQEREEENNGNNNELNTRGQENNFESKLNDFFTLKITNNLNLNNNLSKENNMNNANNVPPPPSSKEDKKLNENNNNTNFLECLSENSYLEKVLTKKLLNNSSSSSLTPISSSKQQDAVNTNNKSSKYKKNDENKLQSKEKSGGSSSSSNCKSRSAKILESLNKNHKGLQECAMEMEKDLEYNKEQNALLQENRFALYKIDDKKKLAGKDCTGQNSQKNISWKSPLTSSELLKKHSPHLQNQNQNQNQNQTKASQQQNQRSQQQNQQSQQQNQQSEQRNNEVITASLRNPRYSFPLTDKDYSQGDELMEYPLRGKTTYSYRCNLKVNNNEEEKISNSKTLADYFAFLQYKPSTSNKEKQHVKKTEMGIEFMTVKNIHTNNSNKPTTTTNKKSVEETNLDNLLNVIEEDAINNTALMNEFNEPFDNNTNNAKYEIKEILSPFQMKNQQQQQQVQNCSSGFFVNRKTDGEITPSLSLSLQEEFHRQQLQKQQQQQRKRPNGEIINPYLNKKRPINDYSKWNKYISEEFNDLIEEEPHQKISTQNIEFQHSLTNSGYANSTSRICNNIIQQNRRNQDFFNLNTDVFNSQRNEVNFPNYELNTQNYDNAFNSQFNYHVLNSKQRELNYNLQGRQENELNTQQRSQGFSELIAQRISPFNKQRIGELNNQRHGELNNQRIGELNNQRHGELNNQRIGEFNTQRIDELNNPRISELINPKIGEFNIQRSGELNNQGIDELNTQRIDEFHMQRSGEFNAQRSDDLNTQRIGKLSNQRTGEFNAQRSGDLNNQRISEFDMQRNGEFNTQRIGQLINKFNTQRGSELNTQRGNELNTQGINEFNAQASGKLNTQRVLNNEFNLQRTGQFNTQTGSELNTQRINEFNVQRSSKLNTQNTTTTRHGKFNNPKIDEFNTQRIGELNTQRSSAFNTQGIGEFNAQTSGKLNTQNVGELSTQNINRLLNNQRINEFNSQRTGELNNQGIGEFNSQRGGELNAQRYNSFNTQEIKELKTQKMNELNSQRLEIAAATTRKQQEQFNFQLNNNYDNNLEYDEFNFGLNTQRFDDNFDEFNTQKLDELNSQRFVNTNTQKTFNNDLNSQRFDLLKGQQQRELQEANSGSFLNSKLIKETYNTQNDFLGFSSSNNNKNNPSYNEATQRNNQQNAFIQQQQYNYLIRKPSFEEEYPTQQLLLNQEEEYYYEDNDNNYNNDELFTRSIEEPLIKQQQRQQQQPFFYTQQMQRNYDDEYQRQDYNLNPYTMTSSSTNRYKRHPSREDFNTQTNLRHSSHLPFPSPSLPLSPHSHPLPPHPSLPHSPPSLPLPPHHSLPHSITVEDDGVRNNSNNNKASNSLLSHQHHRQYNNYNNNNNVFKTTPSSRLSRIIRERKPLSFNNHYSSSSYNVINDDNLLMNDETPQLQLQLKEENFQQIPYYKRQGERQLNLNQIPEEEEPNDKAFIMNRYFNSY